MRRLLVLCSFSLLSLPPHPVNAHLLRPNLHEIDGAGADSNRVVHTVPSASAGNTIELAILNTAKSTARQLRTTVRRAPAWIHLESTETAFEVLEAGEERVAAFTFSVDKSAPVGEPFSLEVEAVLPNGQLWTKTIYLTVEAPQQIHLRTNYPNPFNPQTKIAFELPASSNISLRVYNVLGQEVAVLADGVRPAGYHEATWEAGHQASGLYLYRLVAQAPGGQRVVQQKAMLLAK